MRFNVKSWTKNFDKLNKCICDLKTKPSVTAITETKLNQNSMSANINIYGYNFIHCDSKTCAGGMAFYIEFSICTPVSSIYYIELLIFTPMLSLYKKLNLVKLEDLYYVELGQFMYLYYNKTPKIFNDLKKNYRNSLLPYKTGI